MTAGKTARVGYVVKRYPRYSETFIVNEILAHEAAGWSMDIFALRPPIDTHFQDCISRVRAPVTYLPAASTKASILWNAMCGVAAQLERFWSSLEIATGEDVVDVYQGICLAQEVSQRGITHLHAHFATSAATVARIAARLAGISYSFTAHAKDIFHESVSPEDLRRKLADASAVVTVSDYNVAYLRDEYGAAAARVRRIYNGLDLDAFPFTPARDRPSKIVAVGRLIPKKGFDALIAACHLLAERRVAFSCDIIGTGELEDDLQSLIAQWGLQDRVRLVGPRPQKGVIQRVTQAGVFAAPCVVADDGNRDGLPTVLLEAMALGTPCVSTDVTGIPELVRDGLTGRIVPQNCPVQLADVLGELLADRAQQQRLAHQARALMEAEFDIHKNAARIRQLFPPPISGEARFYVTGRPTSLEKAVI